MMNILEARESKMKSDMFYPVALRLIKFLLEMLYM